MSASQHHLECDDAVELEMPGLVNDAHAATAQHAQNLITWHMDG